MGRNRIIYRGPSLIDGSPIVAVATVGSANSKTGSMIQTWILADALDPITANRTGADGGICGECPHRGIAREGERGFASARTCYVNLGQAPLAVYGAVLRDSYGAVASLSEIRAIGRGRAVRLGSYGDPLAVPSSVWRALLSGATTHTGYTHQRNRTPARLMTSADSVGEASAAWERGERTFRVGGKGDAPIKGREILCPASEEAGRKTTCIKCGLCAGNEVRAPSIFIPAHGAGKKHVNAAPIKFVRKETLASADIGA